MQIIDLFSGIGGLSYGFQQAGHTLLAAYDDDPTAVEYYNLNLGAAGRAHVADVHELDAAALPDADAIMGSPPCQPFSNGSQHYKNRKGPSDERNLIPHFVRLVVAKRPIFFLMENVVGLLSYTQYLAGQLRPLFAAGYLPVITVLNAAHYGVPQDRKRVFIAGYRDNRLPLWPAPTHTRGDAVTTRRALGELLAPAAGQPGRPLPRYLKHFADRELLVDTQNRSQLADGTRYYKARSLDMPAYTVAASERQGSKRAVLGDRAIGLGVRHNRILQTFPPDWQLPTDSKQALRLIGNAVPPLLAYRIAQAMT